MTVCMDLMPSCCFCQSEQSNTILFLPLCRLKCLSVCLCVCVWPHGVLLCVQCKIPYVCVSAHARAYVPREFYLGLSE